MHQKQELDVEKNMHEKRNKKESKRYGVSDWRQPCFLCKLHRKKKKKDQNFKDTKLYTSLQQYKDI